MKYFTPELLSRFASENDDVSEAAEAEWDRACKAYRKHLRAIDSRIPKSIQDFLSNYNMHDARLITFGTTRDPETVSFLFQLDGIDEALWLTYWHLREELRFIEPNRTSERIEVEWLYDEIDVVETGLFKHSILLTGQVEMGLTFHKLELHAVKGTMKTPQEIGLLQPANTLG